MKPQVLHVYLGPGSTLPVDPWWTCQRTGECCQKVAEVVMTTEEMRTLVLHAPPTIQMEFRPRGDGFVAMRAAPCPLHIFGDCTVYEHRPYNCRRFGCMRPFPKEEPFDPGGGNMMIRVANARPARRLAERMQKKAQAWAVKHGWGPPSESRGA